MNIKTWIIDWFVRNTAVKQDEILKNLHEDYFSKGWIDSLKFISFITDLEDKFNIVFSNDEFQNRTFATINGLTQIMENKINGKT